MLDKVTKVFALTLALNDAVDTEDVHYTLNYHGSVQLVDVTKFFTVAGKCNIWRTWKAYLDEKDANLHLDNMIEQLEAELKEVMKKNDTE